MANRNGKTARKSTGLNKADLKRANRHAAINGKTKKIYKNNKPSTQENI